MPTKTVAGTRSGTGAAPIARRSSAGSSPALRDPDPEQPNQDQAERREAPDVVGQPGDRPPEPIAVKQAHGRHQLAGQRIAPANRRLDRSVERHRQMREQHHHQGTGEEQHRRVRQPIARAA